MTEIDKDQLLKDLRRLKKATPAQKEEPAHAIGVMVSANRRKGGRRKAHRRGK